MTTGQLIECVASKIYAMSGVSTHDPTIFEPHELERLSKDLEECGYQRHGYERMYHGATGLPLKELIFIGPTYYQRLKHLVAEKIHMRARGPVQSLVRQPMEGRSRDGGLRSNQGLSENFRRIKFLLVRI